MAEVASTETRVSLGATERQSGDRQQTFSSNNEKHNDISASGTHQTQKQKKEERKKQKQKQKQDGKADGEKKDEEDADFRDFFVSVRLPTQLASS